MIICQIRHTVQIQTIHFHLEQSKNQPLYDYMANKKHTLQIQTILLHLKQSKNEPFYDSMLKQTYYPNPDNSFSLIAKQKSTII